MIGYYPHLVSMRSEMDFISAIALIIERTWQTVYRINLRTSSKNTYQIGLQKFLKSSTNKNTYRFDMKTLLTMCAESSWLHSQNQPENVSNYTSKILNLQKYTNLIDMLLSTWWKFDVQWTFWNYTNKNGNHYIHYKINLKAMQIWSCR